MIQKLIDKLNIKVTYLDSEYIPITKKRRARGAFRWNYLDHQGEILLAKSATDRTKLHEVGHAMNFILGRGSKVSDMIGIESEEFANIMADTLEKLAKK
ncbi:MAG: hypothetical protein RBT05_09685 [Bacteroidales bacterium]|jgi:hypothetical protein|nr:hypothetical protein [Bacteroidales bacterium]